MSNTNTVTKVSDRQVAVAVFNAALPMKAEIGNRAFRTALLAKLREIGKHNNAPVNYGFAKKQAIANKLCKDFGKSAGELIGPKTPMTAEQEQSLNSAMVSAIAIATGSECVQLLDGMTWKVYNKKSGDVVHYATSKKAAYALRNGSKELSCKALS